MNQMVRKQFVAEVEKDVTAGMSDRCRRFVISTGAVDRDNDTIDMAGWKLENYRANPVVLWAHDYSQLPVARALSVNVEGTNLVATAEFADHDFANTVLRLIDGGFLRATSVGFRPMKLVNNVDRGGYDYKEQELLEFSIVPVPANPQALIAAGVDESDVATITKWANGWLKGAAVRQVAAEVEAEAELDPLTGFTAELPPGTSWTCPMHPEVVRDVPGSCPLCGMALEPMTVALEDGPKAIDHDETISRIGTLIKSGRVLSRSNEGKLRSAKEMLDEVLRQVEQETPAEERSGMDCTHGYDNVADCAECTAANAVASADKTCTHGFADPAACSECGQAKGLDLEDDVITLELDDLVLEITESSGGDDVIDIDPVALKAMLAGAFSEAMSSVVRDAATSTMARMRGRVD